MSRDTAIPSTKTRKITLRQLEGSKNGGVYVQNAAPATMRGIISFTVPKLRGNGKDLVRVHKTWIPQDLSEQVTKQQLLDSSEFRSTVSKGLIEILNPEWAETILEREDAVLEKKRLMMISSASQRILQSQALTENANDALKRPNERTKGKEFEEGEVRVSGGEQREDENPTLVRFKTLLETLEDKSEAQIMNALRNEGEFTRAQVVAVKKKFKKKDHPRIAAWAEKQLARF